jgi:hypothetical protein
MKVYLKDAISEALRQLNWERENALTSPIRGRQYHGLCYIFANSVEAIAIREGFSWTSNAADLACLRRISVAAFRDEYATRFPDAKVLGWCSFGVGRNCIGWVGQWFDYEIDILDPNALFCDENIIKWYKPREEFLEDWRSSAWNIATLNTDNYEI